MKQTMVPIQRLPEADQSRFRALAERSWWLTDKERELYLEGKLPPGMAGPVPYHLLHHAYLAMQDEENFRSLLDQHAPEIRQYLDQLHRWCQDPNRTATGFLAMDHRLAANEAMKTLAGKLAGNVTDAQRSNSPAEEVAFPQVKADSPLPSEEELEDERKAVQEWKNANVSVAQKVTEILAALTGNQVTDFHQTLDKIYRLETALKKIDLRLAHDLHGNLSIENIWFHNLEYLIYIRKMEAVDAHEITREVFDGHAQQGAGISLTWIQLLLNMEFLPVSDCAKEGKKIQESVGNDADDYLRPYLLSKLYWIHGNKPEDLVMAATAAMTALEKCPRQPGILACLVHHILRLLVANTRYHDVVEMLDRLEKTDLNHIHPSLPWPLQWQRQVCRVMSGVVELTDPLQMQSCLQAWLREKVIDNSQYDVPADVRAWYDDHPTSCAVNQSLWSVLEDLATIPRELGFAPDGLTSQLHELHMLEEEGRHEVVQARLHHLEESCRETPRDGLRLLEWKSGYLERQGLLETSMEEWSHRLEGKTDLVSLAAWLAVRVTCGRHFVESARRDARNLACYYHWLPFFSELYVSLHHAHIVQSKYPEDVVISLRKYLACGYSDGIYGAIADFLRWGIISYFNVVSNRLLKQAVFSAASYTLFQGGDSWMVYSASAAGWDALAIHSHMCNQPQSLRKTDFNMLALGYDTTYRMLGIFLENIAFNYSWRIVNNINISLNIMYFHGFSIPYLEAWSLYRAMISLWMYSYTAYITYDIISYISFLEKWDSLENQYVGLGMQFHAKDIGFPDFSPVQYKKHLDRAIQNLSKDGTISRELMDHPLLMMLCCRVLLDMADAKDHKVDRFEPALEAFDLLNAARSAIGMREEEIFQDAFLGPSLRRMYHFLAADQRFLTLWHPEETGTERWQRRLAMLSQLEERYPGFGYQDMLNRELAAFQHAYLGAVLSRGRIVPHRPLQSLAVPWSQLIHQGEEIAETISALGSIASEKMRSRFQQGLKEVLFPDSEASTAWADATWDKLLELEGMAPSHGISLLRKHLEEDSSLDVTERWSLFASHSHAWLIEWEETHSRLEQEKNAYLKQLHRQLYELVLTHYTGPDSPMFESFRTRIRHGWLVSSLMDCFARFDLYQDQATAEEERLTPVMRQHLEGVEPDLVQSWRAHMDAFVACFDDILDHLFHKWLWLKDARHPEALLDFSLDHFDPDRFFADNSPFHHPMESIVMALCDEIDRHVNKCFEAIRALLDTQVAAPLLAHLEELQEWLWAQHTRFVLCRDGREKWDWLMSRVQGVQADFRQHLQEYKEWFAFQKVTIRNFTLDEVVRFAWQTTQRIDHARIESRHIGTPAFVVEPGVKNIHVSGVHFPSLLECFKILFQNVVYHALPASAEVGEELPMRVHVTCAGEAHPPRLTCRVISGYLATPERDRRLEQAMAWLADPDHRRQRLKEKTGSGWATIQETLMNRLEGVQGWLEVAGKRQTCAVGDTANMTWPHAWCDLALHIEVATPAQPPATSSVPVPDPEALFSSLRDFRVKILVVEDQPHKFEKIRQTVQKVIPEAGILCLGDLESAARFIARLGHRLHLVLLDQTLPASPLADAPDMATAGLTLLKMIALKDLDLPVIIITQYSHSRWDWQAWMSDGPQGSRDSFTAGQECNSQEYLASLEAICRQRFPRQFQAAIRFSHTSAAWRHVLEEHLARLVASFNLSDTSFSMEEADLIRTGNQALRQRSFHRALACYQELYRRTPSSRVALEGLVLTYTGMDQLHLADRYQKHHEALYSSAEAIDLERKKLASLREWIGERANQLRRNEMLTTLGRLAKTMAHEFNSPINAIRFYANDIQNHLRAGIIETDLIHEDLARIVQVTDILAGLVQHIRELARGDLVQTEELDLHQVLEQVAQLFKTQLLRHDIRLEYDLDFTLPAILANRVRLEQAFINIMQNAMDAFDQIAEPDKCLRIASRLVAGPPARIAVTFMDNGPGMTPDQLAGMLDPGMGSRGTRQGLGLGLTIVREIMQELNGSLELTHHVLRGVKVLLTFPCLETPS